IVSIVFEVIFKSQTQHIYQLCFNIFCLFVCFLTDPTTTAVVTTSTTTAITTPTTRKSVCVSSLHVVMYTSS
ncbi:hypothetical protein EG68_05194, partial [Paragonimus skrjabini miyazakii]